ncbi:hypothetical protein H9Q09_00880 [Aurantimonas sp. DM33-3]|uniref:hypothetical protein n=1 Tax=Aurantimonas sp. DM33-3 TaxID=2766955 RepID=UPI0016529BBC|nr:hypothetical protein [Aurantimonas sp. DM33-3]MBC6714738.1 hypothetical protein [Aurantimonas sp. DM33-3]
MSSVAVARNRVRDLGLLLAPEQPVKVRLDRLHRELVKRLPDLTERRVRAYYDGEVRRVEHDEMVAITEALELQEARCEHRDFLAATNRMVALLAAEGAGLSSAQMAALGRIAKQAPVARSDQAARALSAQGGARCAGARV